MNWKKPFIIVFLLIISSSLTAGCLTAQKSTKNVLRYSAGAEPQTLDPRKSTGLPEANIEAQTFEGLTTIGPNDQPIPAVAEAWTVSEDGLHYRFFLRKNARWSNGDPVTAADFEYAWKSALNPSLASEYAYQLYYLKNGEAYNKGLVAEDQIGVRAIDPYILEVHLEQPTAYFLSLAAFHTYYPVHSQTVQNNDRWATEPKTLIGNGPFKITNWIHNSKIEFSRNDFYWDASRVKMKGLEFILTESSAAELSMFENGQIDMGENIPVSEYPRLLKMGVLKINPFLGTYFFCFNTTKPPLDDPKVRKALSLAINREALIQHVTKGEQKPALAWVPYGLADAEAAADFRIVGGNYLNDNDIAAARRLLADAGYPDGRGLPSITLLYNTNEMHKAIAEAVQEMWKKNLGVTVTLTNQEWKVFLNSRHKGDYQIARHGWIGDYADPMTFIDMFMSDSGNNDAQYRNPDYDRLVRAAKLASDPAVRMQTMHAAEQMLFDDAVIAPVYFYTRPLLIRPNIKGVLHSVLGVVYFKEAYIEQYK
ncbi:MAG: oppA 2 [Firmicutes bacterium]|nr:oppA 2 [Bacillota bacterium]